MELYGTRYQSGSFSLINVGLCKLCNVGSGFHCLHGFSFLFFSQHVKAQVVYDFSCNTTAHIVFLCLSFLDLLLTGMRGPVTGQSARQSG
jgi:hypothetical protein